MDHPGGHVLQREGTIPAAVKGTTRTDCLSVSVSLSERTQRLQSHQECSWIQVTTAWFCPTPEQIKAQRPKICAGTFLWFPERKKRVWRASASHDWVNGEFFSLTRHTSAKHTSVLKMSQPWNVVPGQQEELRVLFKLQTQAVSNPPPSSWKERQTPTASFLHWQASSLSLIRMWIIEVL